MFETKLPPHLLEKWELELADINDEEIDLELFFKFLNRKLISKEAGERNQQTNPTSGIHSQGKAERKTAPYYKHERFTTAATLLSKTTTTPSCIFCKSNHESADCPEFKIKTVEERWKTVKSNRLCFNCLKPSHPKHFSKVCRQPKCSVADCGQRHHTFLHEQRPSTQATQAQPVPTFIGFAASDFKKLTETLLPTTIVKLPANNQTLEVRVLLDCGSQRSYIRKNIAEAIGLKGPTKSVSVTTLGGSTKQVELKDYNESSFPSPQLLNNNRQQKPLRWKPLLFQRPAIS